MHGIVVIDKPDDGRTVETRQCLVSTIGRNRVRNQGKHTLSSIIGSYKSIVTRNARKVYPDFAWQSRFHDHIIRNDESYCRIAEYIKYNPEKWVEDKFYRE